MGQAAIYGAGWAIWDRLGYMGKVGLYGAGWATWGRLSYMGTGWDKGGETCLTQFEYVYFITDDQSRS